VAQKNLAVGLKNRRRHVTGGLLTTKTEKGYYKVVWTDYKTSGYFFIFSIPIFVLSCLFNFSFRKFGNQARLFTHPHSIKAIDLLLKYIPDTQTVLFEDSQGRVENRTGEWFQKWCDLWMGKKISIGIYRHIMSTAMVMNASFEEYAEYCHLLLHSVEMSNKFYVKPSTEEQVYFHFL
jgi:hypothetical protein